MDTSDWISLGAALISIIALTASLIALWKTHLSRFSPILTVGNSCLRIYPIKSDDDRWFLPSISLPISFTNEGAQIGQIDDIRIRVSFPNLPIPGNFEMFYAKWEVDGQKLSRERFDWVENAVIDDWMPFSLLPRETKTKHLVFETRWNEPVIQEKVLCDLEIKVRGNSKWVKIKQWDFCLTTVEWSELAEVGTSFSTSPNNNGNIKEYINPKDLHKYTGTKDEIPKDGFKASPSYLDFSNKDKDEE